MDFSLKAVFGLDATGVKTELKQLRGETNKFVQTWASLGIAAAGAAFVALSKGAAEMASELKKSSAELGINVQSLQVLDALALRNNESQDKLRSALEKTRTATQEAAEGNEKLTRAFGILGVNLNEIQRLPLEQKFAAIARGLVKAENQQAAYNAVADIFGTKVGPQLINSLTDLGKNGFDAAAKSAEAAGLVMSNNTIVALEKAQSAIEEFKKRATIAVGEIIVNFRSEEGLKLLLYQFLKVVGTFGAGIVDAIVESGAIAWAVYKGTFLGLAGVFKNALIDGLIAVSTKFNELMPDFLKNKGFTINIAGLEDLKTTGASVSGEIAKAIAETSPSNFKKEVGEFWDKRIDDQKKIVEAMNQKDFGVDAKKLSDAGKNIEGSIKVGNEGLVDAGKKVAKDIKDAAAVLSGAINRTGRGVEEQSTDALKGLAGRLKSSVVDAELAARGRADAIANPSGRSLDNYFYEAELRRVENELAQRQSVAAYAARYGESAARGVFGDTLTDRALRDLTDTSVRTSTAVENINRNLSEIFQKPKG
jgi:hypothetical protein